MGYPETFEGWLGKDAQSVGNMVWGEFEPKKWEEDDVDIKITHCGICGSDLHTLRSGWAPTKYPCCVGHEIVGTAVRVGKNVTHIQVGDRVGVGAQARSCGQADCPECQAGFPQHCLREHIGTYNGVYPNGIGRSFGGYATYNRTNARFVIKIPAGLESKDAAPMLCGGITIYSPLRQNGCGPGKTVGIVGLGGIGHFGVLFAKALGADRVVAISRRADKREDALKLGADEYIATADDEDWVTKHRRTIDFIVSTVSSPDMPLNDYLKLLKIGGSFVQIGLPDKGELPKIMVWDIIANRVKIGGSGIGAPWEIAEMLKLAADKNIKPWIQTRPMKDANAAVVDMDKGNARYRYVLEA